jgi:hypothetical protein
LSGSFAEVKKEDFTNLVVGQPTRVNADLLYPSICFKHIKVGVLQVRLSP